MVSPVVFWVVAVLLVAAALAMVLARNIVHSALFLIVSFIGYAVLYLFLEADFLAAVQVLVYAGAVSILLVFAVMLTRRGNMQESNLFNNYKVTGALIAAVLFLLIGNMVLNTSWAISSIAAPESTVGPLAELLLGKFVVPFEVAAILLLVAMVGAIIVARGVKDSK